MSEELPCKYQDRSSRFRTQIKKLGMVVHVCNLSTAEAGAGGPWGSLASLPSLFEISRDEGSQKN